MIIQAWGGIGDQLGITAVLREVREQGCEASISVEAYNSFPPFRHEVFLHNPRLSDVRKGVRVKLPCSYDQKIPVWEVARRAFSIGLQREVVLQHFHPEIFLTKEEQREARRLYSLPKRFYVLGTHASCKSRCWSIGKYEELVPQLRIPCVQLTDQPEACNGAMSIQNATLRQAMTIVSFSEGYIGSDTGLSHIAAAFRKPQVVLYRQDGSAPYKAYTTTRYVNRVMDCDNSCRAECRKRIHCLSTITPEEVVSLL